jgi:hypothetical protein
MRAALRVAAVVLAVALIQLWTPVARDVLAQSEALPPPSGVLMPIFFGCLALGAGVSGARGDGVPLAIAGGLSLVPMGFVLLLFPGPARLIGLFDVALIVLGVLLVRTDDRAPEPEEAPDPAD